MVQRYRKACLKSMRHLLPESASLLEVLEARGGIEPPIKVLQTFALPLGDRASGTNAFYHFQWDSHSWLCSAYSGWKKRTAKSGCPTKKSRGVMFHPPRSWQADFA